MKRPVLLLGLLLLLAGGKGTIGGSPSPDASVARRSRTLSLHTSRFVLARAPVLGVHQGPRQGALHRGVVLFLHGVGGGKEVHERELRLFADQGLLAVGGDAVVPPGPAKALHAQLKPLYAEAPERLRHREFPESGHMPREADWREATRDAADWLSRFIPR